MIRKANISDIDEILKILEPYSKEGIVLKRTHEEIAGSIDHFYVSETEGQLSGVAAHYTYSPLLAEIRSLAVRKVLFSKGIGKRLVKKIISDLREVNPNVKIFALTLTPDFFKKCGFKEVEKETLPEKIWKDCVNCIKQNECDEIPMVYAE
ncbi:MAG: N-acetyltransferase [Spirochaetes bacterium]|nr:N-acetyltransferase [Spirochaetota bacterium]